MAPENPQPSPETKIEEIAAARVAYLEAAATMYGHRMEKRAFKQQHKKWWRRNTLARIESDLNNWEARLKKNPDQDQDQKLKAAREKLERHKKDKVDDEKSFEDAKAAFKKLLTEKITRLKGEKSKLGKALQKDLKDNARKHRRLRGRIRDANSASAKRWTPDPAKRTESFEKLREAIREDRRELRGLTQAEAEDPRIQRLEQVRGEIKLYRTMLNTMEQPGAMWEVIEDARKLVPRFLSLAKSVTEYRRGRSRLLESSPGRRTQRNPCTGSREFAIETGVMVGLKRGGVELGPRIGIAISGEIAMQDDRRLQAKLTLQVIPSFNAASGVVPKAFDLELCAHLGFTIWSQTYTFVDEQHFAYYLGYRVASLCRFFHWRLKAHRVDQNLEFYDEQLHQLLEAMLGAAELERLRTYLRIPVIKSVPLRKWKPDFGFSAAVPLTELNLDVSVLNKIMFERSELVIPTDGTRPYARTSTREGFTSEVESSGSLELNSWLKGGLKVAYSHIRNDANPDNDGDYLNITIKTGIFGLIPGLLPIDKSSKDRGGSLLFSLKHGDWKALKEAIQNNAVVLAGSELHADATDHWGLDTDFVSVKSSSNRYLLIACQLKPNCVMYYRWIYEREREAEITPPAVTTPYFDIAFDGSGSVKKSVGLQERIGPATLAYLQPAFNGYRLRPNGRKEWYELLDQHPRGLIALFRNIGDEQGTTPAREDAMKYDALIEKHLEIWKNHRYWGEGDEKHGLKNKKFVDWCKEFRNAHPPETERKTPLRKRFFRQPQAGTLKALEGMKIRFTNWLWRSQQVQDFEQDRDTPWHTRRTYLPQAAGTLGFHLGWNAAEKAYQVVETPVIGAQDQDESTDGHRYRGPEDIYLNADLRRAQDLLVFYQNGFNLVLRVRREGSLNLNDEKLFSMMLRQPWGTDTLRSAFHEMAAGAARDEARFIRRLKALLRFHPRLEQAMQPWITPKDRTVEMALEIFDAQRQAAQDRGSDLAEEVLERIKGPFFGYRVAGTWMWSATL